eukprot:1139819-Pelagomonas_calceolata.AAC.1
MRYGMPDHRGNIAHNSWSRVGQVWPMAGEGLVLTMRKQEKSQARENVSNSIASPIEGTAGTLFSCCTI